VASAVDSDEPRCLRLRGYFQQVDYFLEHTRALRHWFQGPTSLSSVEVNQRDVIVVVKRGRAFARLGWQVPLSYYTQAIDAIHSVGRIYVCGSGIDDEVRGAFLPYAPRYVDVDLIEQFRFIRRFRRILLSNGTLGWWAAFLSDASEIYGPRSSTGRGYAFSGFGNVDLALPGDRYTALDIVEFSRAHTNVISLMYGWSLFEMSRYIIASCGRSRSRGVRVTPAARMLAIALTHRREIALDDYEEFASRSELYGALDALREAGLAVVREHVREPGGE
jgi:hypothetical protein